MKKRILCLLLLVAILSCLFTGCDNNSEVRFDETSLELYVGESYNIHVTVLPAGAELQWATSDPSVATVNGGIVTAVGEGEAVITASLSSRISASCNVTVVQGEKPVIGSKIGNECPSYGLNLVDGSGKVSVKDLRGKVVIINFWGTWCNPCKSELPDFDRIASEYADDVVVLAIHSVNGKNNAPKYISSNFPDSEIIFAYDVPLSSSTDMYYNLLGGGGAYPKTIILDENGIITFSHEATMSYEQLKAQIDALLD